VDLFRFLPELFSFGFDVLCPCLQSRCMPRYFTSFFCGRSTLAICTVGQVWLVFIPSSEIYVLENFVSTFVMRMPEDIDVCCAWGDY
jgi:hypothetical protein